MARTIFQLDNKPSTAEELANTIRPRITVAQAKDAIKTLQQLELIEPDGDGWKSTASTIEVHGKIHWQAIRTWHKQILRIARDSIDSFRPKQRLIGGTTLVVPESALPEIEQLLIAHRRELATLSRKLRDGQDNLNAYQFSSVLFPVSAPSSGALNEGGNGENNRE